MAAIAAVAASVLVPSLGHAGSDGLVGTWLTDGGDSKIKISSCGKSFCGTIVWARTNLLDKHNPDPAQRKRGLVGMTLTKDMHPNGNGAWEGSIYNPENGKTYDITMQLKGADKLEVEGCVLAVLCGSDTWSRHNDETASVAPLAPPRP